MFPETKLAPRLVNDPHDSTCSIVATTCRTRLLPFIIVGRERPWFSLWMLNLPWLWTSCFARRDQLTLSEANVDYGGSISAVVVA